ncbi:8942_t:CDS:2 [Entrophospora sp. SA101]|nr:8942_t:CDS:2 [Entrophospora sp. SA101]
MVYKDFLRESLLYHEEVIEANDLIDKSKKKQKAGSAIDKLWSPIEAMNIVANIQEAGLIENIKQNQAYPRTLNEASCLSLVAHIEKRKHIKIEGIVFKEISINKNLKVIIESFENYKKNNQDPLAIANIMDLTPKGSFIRTLPKDVYKEYLLSLEYLDNIIPNETHDFLVEFFEQFTGFFSWTFQPTSKYTDSRAIGEVTSIHNTNRQRGDGIGFTNDVNKYQLVYIEGSCPYNVKEKKEIDDCVKMMIPEFQVFGGTSYKLEIHLYVLQFTGCYHLVEIENATVHWDFSEIEDFVYFYEAIIKWALLVNSCLIELSDKALKKRSSRVSYGMNQLP